MNPVVSSRESRKSWPPAAGGSGVLSARGADPQTLRTHQEPDVTSICPQCAWKLTALRSRYEQICRAVEQTADSVLITNRDGVIEYVNRAFEQTTGYSAAEAVGMTPRILKSGRQDPKFYERMWAVLLSGRPFRATIINRKKNGELYFAEQTVTPMTDANGTITNFVSVLKDITQLLRSREQEFFLHLAREIQQRFYRAAAVLDGFEIHGAAMPADETGGDYFDFIPGSDGRLTAIVGDVSGHGVGAALVMSEARAYCRAFGSLGLAPDELLRRVNTRLHEDVGTRTFVTIATIALDPKAHSFAFCGAGHVPALLVSKDGEVRHLRSSGLPLGPFAEARIAMTEPQPLERGDVIALITDGITESAAPDGEEFGLTRAARVIVECRNRPAAEIVQQLFEGARGHAASGPQVDDMAAVVCRVV